MRFFWVSFLLLSLLHLFRSYLGHPIQSRSTINLTRAMESSEIKQVSTQKQPKLLLFILNRNGLEENDLRRVLSIIADTQYGVPDVQVLWLSILGKLPDRPHVLFTLSDDSVAQEMAGQTVNITYNNKECSFEISEAFGTDAKEDDNEDPCTLFVSNVPVKIEEEILRNQLMEYFGAVATPDKIIFPRNWQETRTILINFANPECAKIILKACRICMFGGKLMGCSYAKKRPERPDTRPSKPQTSRVVTPKKVKKAKPMSKSRDHFIESLRK